MVTGEGTGSFDSSVQRESEPLVEFWEGVV
jgi:hypothetical protein